MAAKKTLRIPLPIKLETEKGLGDVVKAITTYVGIKPCGGCQKRAEALNRAVVFRAGKSGMGAE